MLSGWRNVSKLAKVSNMVKLTLPTDSEERKNIPLRGGCYNYFPAALIGVAQWSKRGNDKHNPGQPLHHARGKSMDHEECIERHGSDLADLLAQLERGAIAGGSLLQAILDEYDARAWRALAASQEFREKHGLAPLAPAARLPETNQEFADEVTARYKALAGSSAPVGGLVAGCAAANPYKPPQLSPPKDQERVYVERMRERVRKTEDATKEIVDSWGPSS